MSAWPDEATTDPAQIQEWWPEGSKRGIGIATGERSNLTVIDADVKPEARGMDTLKAIFRDEADGEPIPDAPRVKTGSGGKHLYFAFDPRIKSKAQSLGSALDTRSEGGYVVAPPTRHACGERYEWEVAPVGEVPPVPEVIVRRSMLAPDKPRPGRPPTLREDFDPKNAHDVERLKHALGFVGASDYDAWYKVGFILGRAFRWSDEGRAIYLDWSARAHNFDRRRSEANYDNRKEPANADSRLKVGSIFHWAKQDRAYVEWEPPQVDKPFTVRDNPENVQATIEQLVAAAAATPNVYQRGGRLVKVTTGSETPRENTDAEAAFAYEYDALTLPVALSPQVAFVVETKGRARRVEIPYKRAEQLLGYREFGAIPTLRGITRSPLLLKDGTVHVRSGYDPTSQLYLERCPALDAKWIQNRGDILRSVSDATRHAAATRLVEYFDQFDWATPADRLVFLAALFTAGTRHLFDTAPLFGISAHTAGSGKSLLASSINVLWHGARVRPFAWSPYPDETEKRLAAYLRQADPIICFDNVPEGEKLNDPTLCAVLTSSSFGFRILGKTETIQLPTTATFLATGNKLTTTGDMARRTLIARLDPKVADPHKRSGFRFPNLLATLAERRAMFLMEALAFLSGYIRAKRPAPPDKVWSLGSFEAWSAFMDGFLWWAYGERIRREDAAVEDNESVALGRELMEQIVATWPDASEESRTLSTMTKTITAESNRDLRDAFLAFAEARFPNSHFRELAPNTVARGLNALSGKFFQIDGFDRPVRLASRTDHDKRRSFRVEWGAVRAGPTGDETAGDH